jgi:hypothetical protein
MNPSASLPSLAHARDASRSQADEEPPHGDLVTITRVYNTLEAEMLRGCLEAQGIPATLGDVQMIQTDSLLAGALGGVRLMVPMAFAEDAQRAVAAFARGEFAIDELPAGAESAAEEPEPSSQLGMPRLSWLAAGLLAIACILAALAPHRLFH